jgi:hypothetical protein
MPTKKFYDFAAHKAAQSEFGYHAQTFYLWPRQLTSLSLPMKLSWTRVRFESANASLIAKQPGVYAFVIQHDDDNLPPHGYVAYIGETGEDGVLRTLRDRFKDYLRDRDWPKRDNIYELLNKWSTCLFFHFAPVDVTATDLLKVEQLLNDAIIPPYNKRDFSPAIKKLKRIYESK